MMTVDGYVFSDLWTSFYLSEDGRHGVYTADFYETVLDRNGVPLNLKSLLGRPRIENASKALRYLFCQALAFYLGMDGNDNMYVEYEKCDSSFYRRIGMSQDEFKQQISEDVAKYGLEQALDFDGGDCLLVVFPVLRDVFSYGSDVFAQAIQAA